MVWFLIEALLALAVLLGAVWWTMRSRRPEDPLPSAPPSPPVAGEPPGDAR